MDESSDAQKMGISRFFDSSAIRTHPFGSNQAAYRAYRRTERMVSALYLVTNHILPEEPLRKAVRSEALLILEKMLSLRDDMRAPDSSSIIACRTSIRYLMTLTHMLSVAGLLSSQNTKVIVDALDELGNFLEVSKGSPLSESFSLSREDFLDIHGTFIKDIKDSKFVKDMSSIKDGSQMSDNVRSGDTLSVREQGILSILRAGGEFGIRDIASNLPEYSEKMIQRDLVRLVETGRVKKAGSKRWSRYSVSV